MATVTHYSLIKPHWNRYAAGKLMGVTGTEPVEVGCCADAIALTE